MKVEMEEIPLSKDLMPSCWGDDVRMIALFAPFRLKSVNPTDYESKMKFWTEMITKWSLSKGSYTYHDICEAFRRKGKYPACIETVMENMLKEGKLCPQNQVMANSDGWVKWGISTALWPATKVVSTLAGVLGTGGPTVDKTAKYVHRDALKTQSLSFFSSIPSDSRLGSKEELWLVSCRAGTPIDNDALDMMLNWLRSQNLATSTSDGKLHKLSPDVSLKVKPLTEGEICLPRLTAVLQNLEKSIDKMKIKCEEIRNAAKESLLKKDRKMALAQLKKKKMIEMRIEKAETSMDSITHLIETVKQAHSDAETFDALKYGLGALKITMKTKGLDEDNVLDTMDEIKDTLEMYNDVEAAISQSIGMTFDKDELEMELQELMLSEQEENGAGSGGNGGKKLDRSDLYEDLPEVPTASLSSGIVSGEEDIHENLEKRLKKLRLLSQE